MHLLRNCVSHSLHALVLSGLTLSATVVTAGSPAAPVQWTPPPWTPVAQSHLEGVYARRLDRARSRLHACPLDTPGYVLADIALDRKRIFTQYSGDISGRMIGVEAYLSRLFGDEATSLRALLEAVPRYQKSDGHFGAEQHLPVIDRGTDMPVLWGNGRILIGLMEAYEETANPKALAAARKLGDYFVATDNIYCRPENLTSVGGSHADAFSTCYFSCIEGLVSLARETGDTRYRHEAEHIARLALSMKLFDPLHSHGRLSTLRGIVALYELTGDRSWLDGVEREWQTIFERYRLPTGGMTEMFTRSGARDEGCAVADWLRLNLVLWHATGKGRYLDEAERCLKNHFLYQQFAGGGSGHRVMQIMDGEPVAFRSGGTDAYWCCCEHWPRALIDVARLGITTAPDGVRVNLFAGLDTTLSAAGTSWNIRVQETVTGVRIQISPKKVAGAVLHIHRPGWAQEAKVATPRGLTVRQAGDEWLVSGRWQGQPTVEISLAPKIHLERSANGGTVFVRGDDLLVAHAVPANAWLFEKELKARPVVAWRDDGMHIRDDHSANRGANKSEGQGSGFLRRQHRRVPCPGASFCTRLEAAGHLAHVGVGSDVSTGRPVPHRCWFSFSVTNAAATVQSGQPADLDSVLYLTAAATGPCRVILNGHEVAHSRGWDAPVDGFVKGRGKDANTLLIVCDPASDPEHSPGMIAGAFDCRGVRGTDSSGWQVCALSREQAQQPAKVLAEEKDSAGRRRIGPVAHPFPRESLFAAGGFVGTLVDRRGQSRTVGAPVSVRLVSEVPRFESQGFGEPCPRSGEREFAPSFRQTESQCRRTSAVAGLIGVGRAARRVNHPKPASATRSE